MSTLKKLELILKNNTWLVVLLSVTCAMLFPKTGLKLKPILTYLLMFMMFLGCMNVLFKDIINHFKEYKKISLMLLIIHILSPLLILLFLKPYFSDEIFLGLILASTMVSGVTVVALTDIYGGTTTGSLVVTSISNILSPVVVPFLVYLFAKTSIKIDTWSMGVTIFKLIIIPLVTAAIIRRTFIYRRVLKNHSRYISIVVLFVLVFGVVSSVRDVIVNNLKLSLIVALIVTTLVVMNFILGYKLGRNKGEKIAYGITASWKNFTLSTLLALTLFGPMVAVPSVIYTVIENLLLIPMQLIFSQGKNKE